MDFLPPHSDWPHLLRQLLSPYGKQCSYQQEDAKESTNKQTVQTFIHYYSIHHLYIQFSDINVFTSWFWLVAFLTANLSYGTSWKKENRNMLFIKTSDLYIYGGNSSLRLFDALYLQSGTFGDTIVLVPGTKTMVPLPFLEGLFWRCALIDARYVMIKPGFM